MSEAIYTLPEPFHIEALAELLADAFHSTPDQCRTWLEETGLHQVRALLERDQPLACLILIPGDQWFLGRAVPMTGVAGVAVSPTARGRGLAKQLMAGLLDELHREGVALSALYASTMRLYRGVGYGAAGTRCCYRVPLKQLALRGQGLKVTRETEEDASTVEALQAAHRRQHGALLRSPYHWRRARRPRGQETTGYLIWRDEQPVANLRFQKRRSACGAVDLDLTDLFAADAPAAREALALLSSHQSLCRDVLWYGGPSSAWLSYLPDRVYRAELQEEWMLRIVDLPRALQARGYPSGMTGQIEFTVHDPILASNSRSWRLEVAQGEARCSPVESHGFLPAPLEIQVKTLAGLYTGHLTADQALLTGGLQGEPKAVERLGALLTAPAPDLPDFF